jgi:redox-sensitive bicupin YhaK (pirin superfamily)
MRLMILVCIGMRAVCKANPETLATFIHLLHDLSEVAMIIVRKSDERGHFNFGWLQTYHTFSFGDYHDPAFMAFRSLRVLNEDVVQPKTGFPTHGHRDFEILTFILSGELQHRDSMGNTSVIRSGEVQRMTAGTGVTHSEQNPSQLQPVHLLQIWIVPQTMGLTPSYEQKQFDPKARSGKLCLLVSPDGHDGSVSVHQDVSVYGAKLDTGQLVNLNLSAGRHAWVQVTSGQVLVNDLELLEAGDGAAVSEESLVKMLCVAPAEFLVFDLA